MVQAVPAGELNGVCESAKWNPVWSEKMPGFWINLLKTQGLFEFSKTAGRKLARFRVKPLILNRF